MRHHIGTTILAASALLLAACGGIPEGAGDAEQVQRLAAADATRYVVVFEHRRAIPTDANALVHAAGGSIVQTLPQVGVAIATSDDPDFASALEAERGVRAVGAEGAFRLLEPQAVHRADVPPEATTAVGRDVGTSGVEWGFFEEWQWNVRRVKADAAWEVTTGSHDTVVAVIDTGVAWNHPDLAPNLVHAACFRTFAVLEEEAECAYPDLHWHGTYVAGLVAANSGGGVVGVGPDLGLASYNVFELFQDPADPTEYYLSAASSSIWRAMLDAAERGFDVINLSLGAYDDTSASRISPGASRDHVAFWVTDQRVAEYVSRQGVTVVSSSGNSGRNLNGPVDAVPAGVPATIAVSGTGIRPAPAFPHPDAYDVLAVYSDHGAYIDLAAPSGDCGPDFVDPDLDPCIIEHLITSAGVDLDVTDPTDVPACVASHDCGTGWFLAAGTSAAAPLVAGAAGLVRDIDPHLSPQRVRQVLGNSAEPIGHRQAFGRGMLDASEAVRSR